MFIQFISASYFVLMNYYFTQNGYIDYEIAQIIEKRFLGVIIFAFPLGLFIKGKRLKPFFYIAALGVPSASLLLVYAVESQLCSLVNLAVFLFGISIIFIQTTSLPFIILNAKKEVHSESIALHFQTWVTGTIVVGMFYFVMKKLIGDSFDEKNAILLFSFLGYISVYFIHKIDFKENVSEKFPLKKLFTYYDWNLIIKAILPTLFIAIGAGFTMPFISLFFENVHTVNSTTFSLISSLTFIIVFLGMGIMPSIRKKYGYKVSILLFQSLSIVFLVLMATTEWYKELPFAGSLALFFYVFRQPLMNVAGPMTSELSMYFVGKKNQELISALNASIWSGSWFFSSRIFGILREREIAYVNIFLITAVMYVLGVLWYNYLINQYDKQEKANT
tara:strand:+ start:1185 stop:2354 length:1170 start_codon:yes stop_codon:yes gene_type:complete